MKPSGINNYQWWLYNFYFIAGNYLGQKITQKYFEPKKQKLFRQIELKNGLANRGGKIPTESIECDDITPFLKKKNQLSSSPLIFRGKGNNWPCMSKWDETFFLEKLGHCPIDIIDNVGFAEEGTEFTETTMETFITEMKKDKKHYLRFSR